MIKIISINKYYLTNKNNINNISLFLIDNKKNRTITILNPLPLNIKKRIYKMEPQSQNPYENYLTEFSTRLTDIEEKQRLIKDRVLLIGENLISSKEEQEQEMFEIKAELANLNQEIKSIKQLLARIINTIPELARRAEIEIIQKQFDMFEPLKSKIKK